MRSTFITGIRSIYYPSIDYLRDEVIEPHYINCINNCYVSKNDFKDVCNVSLCLLFERLMISNLDGVPLHMLISLFDIAFVRNTECHTWYEIQFENLGLSFPFIGLAELRNDDLLYMLQRLRPFPCGWDDFRSGVLNPLLDWVDVFSASYEILVEPNGIILVTHAPTGDINIGNMVYTDKMCDYIPNIKMLSEINSYYGDDLNIIHISKSFINDRGSIYREIVSSTSSKFVYHHTPFIGSIVTRNGPSKLYYSYQNVFLGMLSQCLSVWVDVMPRNGLIMHRSDPFSWINDKHIPYIWQLSNLLASCCNDVDTRTSTYKYIETKYQFAHYEYKPIHELSYDLFPRILYSILLFLNGENIYFNFIGIEKDPLSLMLHVLSSCATLGRSTMIKPLHQWQIPRFGMSEVFNPKYDIRNTKIVRDHLLPSGPEHSLSFNVDTLKSRLSILLETRTDF